jgi:hypothetical protein
MVSCFVLFEEISETVEYRAPKLTHRSATRVRQVLNLFILPFSRKLKLTGTERSFRLFFSGGVPPVGSTKFLFQKASYE